MINGTFYPTPSSVISKMLQPLVERIEGYGRHLPYHRILEPSAGKGDILDYLTATYRMKSGDLYAIEIEPELQMVLTGKGYRLIDSDFLKYGDHYLFDLIVMNPPFDTGVDHILKAWDVLHAGDVVCILNAETVNNPYTEKRKLLARIISEHGRYENIGQAFKSAERAADVECVIVWLHKDAPKSSIGFDRPFDQDFPVDEAAFSANPLAHGNVIESLVSQYNHAARLLIEMHQTESQYRFYVQSVISVKDEATRAEQTLNEKLDELKAAFWKYIFDKTKLGQQTTSQFQKKFYEFSDQQKRMAFTVANIMSVLEMFFLNKDSIIQECITAVFDKATAYHEKNVIHTEGWKTNKSWKIAPKVIIPNGIAHDAKWNGWRVSYGWSTDFFADIDKALCFLSGRKIEDIGTLSKALDMRLHELSRGMQSVNHDAEFESTFFKIRVFKKGTVHITFKDKDLLARFNQAAAKGKNWVGAGY